MTDVHFPRGFHWRGGAITIIHGNLHSFYSSQDFFFLKLLTVIYGNLLLLFQNANVALIMPLSVQGSPVPADSLMPSE